MGDSLVFLFKIWIFEFDFVTLFSFLLGVAVGIAIFAIIYLILVLLSLNNKKNIVSTQVHDVSDEEIKELIIQTQNAFKDKDLRGENTLVNYCKDLCSNLVYDIATRFFPKSKRPLFELSIDEVLMLCIYVSNRIDEVLNHRGIKVFRKVKISTILGFSDVKKTIDDNPIVKATKKYKITETFKAAKNVINTVNPIFWVRKLVVDSAMTLVIKKLCLVIISIVGEETYKIYSKSVFRKDVCLDTGVNSLVDQLEEDIKETSSDVPNECEDLSEDEKEKKISQILDEFEKSKAKKRKRKIFSSR